MCEYIVSYICAEPFASFHQDKAIGKPSKRGTQVIRVLRFFLWTQAKIKRE